MSGFTRVKIYLVSAVISAGCIAYTASAWADVRLAGLFGDHMVVQRDMKAPVWGTADPGEAVTVTVAGVKASVKADSDGRWMVRLPALKAGGPYELTVAGKNRIALADVMIGEVWLCSGQSNMWWPVGSLKDIPADAAPSDDPGLRLYAVWSPENESFGRTPSWSACTTAGLKEFSAVGYYFGRTLRRELGITVGLIHSSMGGSLPEAWMKKTTLDDNPQFRPIEAFWDSLAAVYPNARPAFDRWLLDLATAKTSGSTPPPNPNIPFVSKPYRYYMHHPQICRDAQLAPLVPFGIRGVIWYQGESSTPRAWQYRTLFPAMIREWREDWGRKDLPFYFVQLSNIKSGGNADRPASWPELREAQFMARKVPNTEMAVTFDVGDANNVHFNNKWEVGRRLALIALAKNYGRNIEYSGPLFKSAVRKGSVMKLRFDHAGGLAASGGGVLAGFTVAGRDRVFRKAEARIGNGMVLVSSAGVKEPEAVRYSWEDDPRGNLVNGDGLPASPFRTDSWPGVTDGVLRPYAWEQ